MQRTPLASLFRPKRFGFGWAPASREGWAVTAAIIAIIVAISRVV